MNSGPTFIHRENEMVQTQDGRTVWLSRAVAVVSHVVAIVDETAYVLLNQRGPSTPDAKWRGSWSLPCGYLDWDESAEGAVRREVWEECGLDLYLLENSSHVRHGPQQPWHVMSQPEQDARQNVCMHHGMVVEISELPKVSVPANSNGEVSGVEWFPVADAAQMELAFNHQLNIQAFRNFLRTIRGIAI